jgi:hypothetical protein
LLPTTAFHAPDGFGVRRREQPADRAHDVDRADRPDQIVAHSATHQFAIKHDVVHAADHDDARACITALGEGVESGKKIVAAARGLDHDDIGRRRVAVSLDRGRDAAHLNLEMGFAKAPILAGRLYGSGGLDGFAKGLHRHARRRRNMLAGTGFVVGGGNRRQGLHGVLHHWPMLVILPLPASGLIAAVLSP